MASGAIGTTSAPSSRYRRTHSPPTDGESVTVAVAGCRAYSVLGRLRVIVCFTVEICLDAVVTAGCSVPSMVMAGATTRTVNVGTVVE